MGVEDSLLFAFPSAFGRPLDQRTKLMTLFVGPRRQYVPSVCRLTSKATGSGDANDEASGESKKVTPLSQWVSEIEKDLGDVSTEWVSNEGARQRKGLSLDWDRNRAAPSTIRPSSGNGSGGAQEVRGKRVEGVRSAWSVVKKTDGGVARPARDREKGGSAGADRKAKGVLYNTGVLRDLTRFQQLEELLDELEPFVDAPEGVMTAPQAVAAMNHLKRLAVKESSRQKAGGEFYGRGRVSSRLSMTSMRGSAHHALLMERVDRCMRSHAAVVNRGMYRLTAKHVALALNAVRDRDVASVREFKELFRAGGKRVQELASAALRDRDKAAAGAGAGGSGGAWEIEAFDSQNIANIVNAFASAQVRNGDLFNALAQVAVQLRPLEYTPQAVAIILNAYARAGVFDRPLFDFLALAALGLDPALFSAQHVANIANAFAKADLRDEVLLRYLSATAQVIPARSYSLQAVANILSAFSHFGVRDEPLYEFLGSALRDDIQGAGSPAAGGKTTPGGMAVLQVNPKP
jgi:hypothetical protein